jgi:hypothetical protein
LFISVNKKQYGKKNNMKKTPKNKKKQWQKQYGPNAYESKSKPMAMRFENVIII